MQEKVLVDSFQCQEIQLQVKWVMASFCCCGNSNVIVSPDHNKFSCLSNVTVVVTFPNLCKWQCSVGGIDPEKPYP